MVNVGPAELGIHWCGVPGVTFALRSLRQAEKFQRIRDSIVDGGRLNRSEI
jgi:hypothetical protein